MPDKLVVVGQGYVGLPLAMRAVEAGFDVVGFDTDESKVKQLNAGESYVEDITDERLGEALGTGRYLPTGSMDDCAGFDAYPMFASGAILLVAFVTQGNLGTAFRHRGQILPVLIVPALLGAAKLAALRATRSTANGG